MGKAQEKIDFVVLWVDSNDPKWCAEKEKWEKKLGIAPDKNVDNSEIRYRDWELLRYWFRGVEQFAPWVNKIHFVTCGHLPEWLNTEHPKLHIVKHSDFMPKDALPTFNSNAIEATIHKIDGLAEQFVLFNDDTFLIGKIKVTDFFKNGKPVNMMSLHPIIANPKLPSYRTLMNNLEIINSNFDFKHSIKMNKTKYISLKQGKYLFRTLPLLNYTNFPGFANYHTPISYLKTTFSNVWAKTPEQLNQTVHTRFRNYATDINHWVFNYWQYASGNFYQKSPRYEKNTTATNKNIGILISSQKYHILGIGDANVDDFQKTKKLIIDSFEKILPKKSEFEK